MMALRKLRASRPFALVVVCIALMKDMLVGTIVYSVMPFYLFDELGLQGTALQLWNSVLVAILGICNTGGASQW